MSTTQLAVLRRTEPSNPPAPITRLDAWRNARQAERARGNPAGSARRPVFIGLRGYDAARHDNLTFGWTATSASANEDVRMALETVRARSRDLAANNDYMRRFLRMVEINVVGPHGFTYKNLATNDQGKKDEAARDLVALHWAAWCKRGSCEITGRYSFARFLKQVIRAVARDGEYLVRKIRGRAAGNPYGFALQLLDIDRLDVRFHGEYKGNRLIMGVEVDSVGRPVAYHLHTKHPKEWSYVDRQGRHIERVPAEEILHDGLADRPEQMRFMPWGHTAMLRLEMLGKFQTAAVAAARKGAETLGVLERSPDADPTVTPLADSDDEDAEGADGELYQTSLPGQWDTLPAGYKMAQFESQYPNALFGEFVKDALRGVSAGLNVAYNGLANDLEGVNFSSIRAGVLEERDGWLDVQGWLVESLLDPVHDEWLAMGLLAGAITFPDTGKALPAFKAAQFSAHTFTGRRWPWVDPAKDAAANETAIRNGSKSRQQVAGEQGRDFFDVVDELAEEQAYCKAKGVSLGEATAAVAAGASNAPAGKTKQATDEDTDTTDEK